MPDSVPAYGTKIAQYPAAGMRLMRLDGDGGRVPTLYEFRVIDVQWGNPDSLHGDVWYEAQEVTLGDRYRWGLLEDGWHASQGRGCPACLDDDFGYMGAAITRHPRPTHADLRDVATRLLCVQALGRLYRMDDDGAGLQFVKHKASGLMRERPGWWLRDVERGVLVARGEVDACAALGTALDERIAALEREGGRAAVRKLLGVGP